MLSGHAVKPGDVMMVMNGKSIEVVNTDAEGRLILADAIYYTSSTFKPHTLIDMATLTGSMSIALGEVYSDVFTNSDVLWKQLSTSGKKTNDKFWRMPFEDAYQKGLIKSNAADLVNSGDRYGASSVAASFSKRICLHSSHINWRNILPMPKVL